MINTRLNRWLKRLAILLVIVLIVMLLIPSELTDEQLAQIKPGMTLHQVKKLLGKPETRGIVFGASLNKRTEYLSGWFMPGKFGRPTLHVSIPQKTIVMFSDDTTVLEHTQWTGRHSSLWVEHNDEVIVKVWLFPITRSGGGLQDFIDSIKECWNDWRR